MMSSFSNPLPLPDPATLPPVRLEVRTGSGRAVGYEVGSEEFLIGGADGCDLRLPLPAAVPVACQLLRKPEGVRVRRLSAAVPVLLNGSPLPANTPVPLAHADCVSVAGVEIVVALHHSDYLSPKLIPFNSVAEPPREAALPAEAFAELERRKQELDEQTKELEADRVLWYRRRQEMEQELARIPQAADLIAREEEAARARAELHALRQQVAEEHARVHAAEARLQEERAAFAAEREQQRAADAQVELRRHQAEDEIARRWAEFDAEWALHQEKLAELPARQARLTAEYQELTRQRETFAADRDILTAAREAFEAERAVDLDRLGTWETSLTDREADLARRESDLRIERETHERERRQLTEDVLRSDRRRAELDGRESRIAAREREADAQLDRLQRDAAEWEETLRLAAAEQDRLRSEADRLDRQRAELDTQAAKLTERAAQLEAQHGVLAVLRAKLERTREDLEREAVALAAARLREDEAQNELRDRIREAEQLRADLSSVQASAVQQQRHLGERDSLLSAGLEEIRQQKDALAAVEARLLQREAELDVRSAEFAEQAGALKGRMAQALDLQARLEADRVALREREAALAQAENARQMLQEQLLHRAEDLAARAKAVDEQARQLAADRLTLEEARTSIDTGRLAAEEELTAARRQIELRAAEIERQTVNVAEREASVARQLERLKEVGQAVAAERKELAEQRATWEAHRAAAEAETHTARDELDAIRARATAEMERLRAQAPELEEQGKTARDRLAAAKEVLRGHLAELHEFARTSRDDLEAVRAQVRAEADQLREREAALDGARSEHRLAVTAFRQQLVEWQGKVAEIKQALSRGESRLDNRQAAVDEAARQVDATSRHLAVQVEQLKRERAEVVQRRTEVERHLADMREWYRKKLRELAVSGQPDEPPALKLHETSPELEATPPDDIEPGDKQLGELLRSLELVDADTLAALWAEAGRQRRTLRQVLLTSGVVTLYQLALIEAGNLDGLMLGRFRAIDRLRVTPREAVYRVLDPTRLDDKSAGVFLLRHLSEAEAQDAVHPDEFVQRYAAARDAAHPNLTTVVEVGEVNGRPAVLLEWPSGLFSADWPAHAAHPGCWVRLMTMAAEGIDAAHRTGLAHGRLTSDSFVLTPDGVVKVTGFGEPPWLDSGPSSPVEPTPAADLRAFGQTAYGWSQLAVRKRAKAFPAGLAVIIRRLQADPEPPMADTVAADQPYESAAELVADLKRIARETPFSDDAWEKLLRHVADHAPDGSALLRQSA